MITMLARSVLFGRDYQVRRQPLPPSHVSALEGRSSRATVVSLEILGVLVRLPVFILPAEGATNSGHAFFGLLQVRSFAKIVQTRFS